MDTLLFFLIFEYLIPKKMSRTKGLLNIDEWPTVDVDPCQHPDSIRNGSQMHMHFIKPILFLYIRHRHDSVLGRSK